MRLQELDQMINPRESGAKTLIIGIEKERQKDSVKKYLNGFLLSYNLKWTVSDKEIDDFVESDEESIILYRTEGGRPFVLYRLEGGGLIIVKHRKNFYSRARRSEHLTLLPYRGCEKISRF